ncbi:MAG: hypothetical protein WBM50_00815, partial [Acidimicrobiales bacterium]
TTGRSPIRSGGRLLIALGRQHHAVEGETLGDRPQRGVDDEPPNPVVLCVGLPADQLQEP